MTRAHDSAAACLEAGDFEVLVDRETSPAERIRFEEHLADCQRCRQRLAEVWRESREDIPEPVTVPPAWLERVASLVGPVKPAEPAAPTSWRGMRILVPLAAGLLLALGLAFGVLRTGSPPEGRLLRGSAVTGFEVTAPLDGEQITRRQNGRARFAWNAAEDARLYRLVVLDGAGARVFEAETTEVSLETPSTTLPVGALYWQVEAQLADGSSLRSPWRLLTVVEPGR